MNLKTFASIGIVLAVLLACLPPPMAAQTNTFTSTTLSSAVAASDKVVCLASATGVSPRGDGVAGSFLFFDAEQVQVRTVTAYSTTCFNVIRGPRPSDHFSGTTVYIGPGNWFQHLDPPIGASCTKTSQYAYPWIALDSGKVFTCAAGVWLPGETSAKALWGSCSGVATASQTLGLYNLGQRAALTCTSTVTTLGPVMDRAGTVQYFSIAVSAAGTTGASGVFTVLKNGSATNVTCTLGTGTSCSDSTHTARFVAGDVLSVQFTTQAAETLADVKSYIVIR